MTKRLLIALALASAAVTGTSAQRPAAAQTPDNYDEMFARFLAEARNLTSKPADSSAWMNGLMLDPRARQLNDLVTVKVIESITASGSADAQLGKTSSATHAWPSIFGLEKKLPSSIDPTNLVSGKSDTQFKGAGTTTRTGDLTTTMTARVSEVLPSGDLVIEAVREIEINGDRQIVVLTGVARRADIGPNNVISSTALGDLRIRYFGRGLMKDSLSPGWLVKVLNKIF
ncbi:MAG: flagellar basal body L-ring protein FlgH [Vicinamibacterales bacterium]